jgi:NTE family protein
VRAGYDISWFEAGVHTGTPPITSIGGKVDMARVRWTFDGMDSASVPARGLRIAAEGRWILSAPLAEGSYPQAEITALFAQPVSRRGSLIVSGQLGTTFTRNAAPELAYTLGGPWRLGAYNRDEFRGNHYFLTGLGYRHHIAGLSPLLGGKIFALASFESGGAFLSFAEPDIQYQGSAGLIMETRLGPFSLMGAAGRGGRGKIYFTFGRFF